MLKEARVRKGLEQCGALRGIIASVFVFNTFLYFPCADPHAGGASAAVEAGMSAFRMSSIQRQTFNPKA